MDHINTFDNSKQIIYKISIFACNCTSENRTDYQDTINKLDDMLADFNIDNMNITYIHDLIESNRIDLRDAIDYRITTESGKEKTGFCLALKAEPSIFVKYLYKISCYLEGERLIVDQTCKEARKLFPEKKQKLEKTKYIKQKLERENYIEQKLEGYTKAPSQFNILRQINERACERFYLALHERARERV